MALYNEDYEMGCDHGTLPYLSVVVKSSRISMVLYISHFPIVCELCVLYVLAGGSFNAAMSIVHISKQNRKDYASNRIFSPLLAKTAKVYASRV